MMAQPYKQIEDLIAVNTSNGETAIPDQKEQAEHFVAINAQDGTIAILDQEEPLTEKHRKLLIVLCWVLVTQASSFSVIQLLDMLSRLIGNLVPKPIQTIATGSGLALLGIAEITALIELAIRIKLLMDAKAETVSENRIFSALSLLKLITVSAFCLNAFFEQTGTPDSKAAKTAGFLFLFLILGDIFNDIKMFLSLSSMNFWSTTSFIDCIFKTPILLAAIAELFPVTGALPYGVAGSAFAAVAMNVDAAKTQLSLTDAEGVSKPFQVQYDYDDERKILSPEHSINVISVDASENDPLKPHPVASNTALSNNRYSRWTKQVSEIASHIGQYVKGEPFSPAPQL
jgi:hypothetical protein